MWKKMRAKIVERKWYLLVLAIFWLVILISLNPFGKRTVMRAEIYHSLETQDITPNLEKGVVFREKNIEINKGEFEGFEIKTVTHGGTDDSLVQLELLYQNSGELAYAETIDTSELKDNKFLKVIFDEPIVLDEDTKFVLELTGLNGTADNSIALYCGIAAEENNIELEINGQAYDNPICFISLERNEAILILAVSCWAILILISFALVLIINGTTERDFLIFAGTLGVLLIFFNPFVHPLDEQTHFIRSYAIGHLNLNPEVLNGALGYYVPDNYIGILNTTLNIKSYFTNPDIWNQAFHAGATSFYVHPYMSGVIPFSHAIGASAAFLGWIFHWNVIVIILVGRLFDYVFYVGCAYFAIRNMKKYKTLFFTVAALPLSLWLAASFSTDPALMGTSLLFISICLKYYFDEEINKVSTIDHVLLLICVLFIASVKYFVYVPILLLFFLIPRRLFSKKSYWAMIALASASIIVMAGWQLWLLVKFPYEDIRNGADVSVAGQLKFMAGHIGHTIRVLVNPMRRRAVQYLEGFTVGAMLETVGKAVGWFAVFGACLEKNKYNDNEKKATVMRRLCVFIVLVVTAMIILTLYAGFTPVGRLVVDGIQTRYFIPIMILIMLLASGIHVENKIKNYERKVGLFMIICLGNQLAATLMSTFCWLD